MNTESWEINMNTVVKPSTEIREVEKQEKPATMKGPGDILRNARLKKDLTEADIARKLHLSRMVIQSLENNEYKKLPGDAFVRGYLRSYARFVEASVDEVIAAYNTLGLDEQHVPSIVPVTRVKKQITASDKGIRWMSYLIILALVVLVVLWWRGHSNTVGSAISMTEDATLTAVDAAAAKKADEVPVEPISGNDVANAIGNSASSNTAQKQSNSEKMLNSDRLKDKKIKNSVNQARNKKHIASSHVATNSNLDDQLNMNGFESVS